jgi:plastocyanin
MKWTRSFYASAAVLGLLVLALGLVACGDDDDDDDDGPVATATATTGGDETPDDGDQTPADGGAEEERISVTDNAFPAETRVAVGTTVVWDFSSAANPHSVKGTSDNASGLDSETFTGSGTYEFTFEEAGTYEYQCGVHGAAMSGTLVVS